MARIGNRCDQRRARHRRQLLRRLPGLLHILFICLFLLTEVGNLKRALGSVLMPGDDDRWLSVWERITTSISRSAIGVVVIATIAGTTQGP